MGDNKSTVGPYSRPFLSLAGADVTFGDEQNGRLAADGKAVKGKNHPSFTLILRKQLPVGIQEEQAMSTSGQSETTDENVGRSFKDVSLRVDMQALKNKQDFEFAYPWQIWLLDAGASDWNVKKYGAPVRTGKQFWSVYQQLHQAPEEVHLKNLMIFQDKIVPMWEAPDNLGGGRWFWDFNGTGRDCLLKANYWTQCLEIVLSGCLGPPGDLIVGLILHFKAQKYRVSLWIRSCSDFNQVIQLGANIRNCLNLRCQLKFELHSATPASETVVTLE